MKNYYSYTVALKNNNIKPGARVIACPDRQSLSLVGTVDSITDNSIIVQYLDKLIELDRNTGKLTAYCDTSVDINLIEVDD